MLSSAHQNTKRKVNPFVAISVKSTEYNFREFIFRNKRLLSDLNSLPEDEISSSPLYS